MKLILSGMPRALFFTGVFLLPAAVVKSDEGTAFFESKIRPILIESCYDCHSAEGKHKGGLSLDTKEGVLEVCKARLQNHYPPIEPSVL